VWDDAEEPVAPAAERAPIFERDDPLAAQPLCDVRRNKLRNEGRSAGASGAWCLC
jgi:hypothetical protein